MKKFPVIMLLLLIPVLAFADTPPEQERCGTPALLEGASEYSGRGRPTLSGTEYTFTSPDGYFLIHWTNSGADATTQTYANNVAEAADYSWEVECDDMGYIHPPPDNNAGGNNLYDIYIMSIGPLGYCSSGGEYHPPDSTQNCSASHIVICKGLSTDLAKVTVSHEFQHAIQMSYDYEEPVWFMENCAVWMEEQVYPDINDYWGYLGSGDNPLRKPWWDIREQMSGMYYYGGCLWPMYMQFRFNTIAPRTIWEYCSADHSQNMLEAQDDMFDDYGYDWKYGFMQYGYYRWFTAGNWYSGCDLYSSEASNWNPGPYVFYYHNISSLPASGDEGVYEPENYGIHWIKVDLADYQGGWVEMAFDGRDYFEWSLGVIMVNEGSDNQFAWYNCDGSSGEKTVAVEANGWDYVVFFPAFLSETSLDHYYEFDISYESGIEGVQNTPALIDLSVSSNPLQSGDAISFDMPFAGNATIKVIDITGRTVTTLMDEDVAAGTHSLVFSENELTGGTYFISLFAGNQIATRKVVIQ